MNQTHIYYVNNSGTFGFKCKTTRNNSKVSVPPPVHQHLVYMVTDPNAITSQDALSSNAMRRHHRNPSAHADKAKSGQWDTCGHPLHGKGLQQPPGPFLKEIPQERGNSSCLYSQTGLATPHLSLPPPPKAPAHTTATLPLH